MGWTIERIALGEHVSMNKGRNVLKLFHYTRYITFHKHQIKTFREQNTLHVISIG